MYHFINFRVKVDVLIHYLESLEAKSPVPDVGMVLSDAQQQVHKLKTRDVGPPALQRPKRILENGKLLSCASGDDSTPQGVALPLFPSGSNYRSTFTLPGAVQGAVQVVWTKELTRASA